MRKILKFLKAIDNFIIQLFDVGWTGSYNYQLPQFNSGQELRQIFIKDYFASQPSLFKLIVFKTYILVKHSIFIFLRKSFGLAAKVLNISKNSHEA